MDCVWRLWFDFLYTPPPPSPSPQFHAPALHLTPQKQHQFSQLTPHLSGDELCDGRLVWGRDPVRDRRLGARGRTTCTLAARRRRGGCGVPRHSGGAYARQCTLERGGSGEETRFAVDLACSMRGHRRRASAATAARADACRRPRGASRLSRRVMPAVAARALGRRTYLRFGRRAAARRW